MPRQSRPPRPSVGPPASRGPAQLVLLLAAAVLMIGSLAMALLWAPAPKEGLFDAPYAQRILYLHPPTAWVAYLAFGLVFVGSIGYLRTGAARWDNLARASASTGVLFCLLAIVTGPIWAREEWGYYWRWEDTKLTLTFIMFLVYIGYVTLRSGTDETPQEARTAAAVGIVGFAAVPLSFAANRLWISLHPAPLAPPVPPASGESIAAGMVVVLVFSMVAMTVLFAYVLLVRIDALELAARVERLRERLLGEVG